MGCLKQKGRCKKLKRKMRNIRNVQLVLFPLDF